MKIQDSQTELRERLLAQQASEPNLKLEYERKLNAMFEIQLPVWKKLWLMTVMGFCAVAGIGAAILAATETLTPAARAVLVMGAVFSGAWLAFLIRMVRRGTLQRRIDPPLAAGMAIAFSMMMCVLLAVGGLPTDRVLLVALLTVFPAGLILIRSVIEQSEMRTQERLLELQYRIATLAERFDEGGDAGAGVRR